MTQSNTAHGAQQGPGVEAGQARMPLDSRDRRPLARRHRPQPRRPIATCAAGCDRASTSPVAPSHPRQADLPARPATGATSVQPTRADRSLREKAADAGKLVSHATAAQNPDRSKSDWPSNSGRPLSQLRQENHRDHDGRRCHSPEYAAAQSPAESPSRTRGRNLIGGRRNFEGPLPKQPMEQP